MQASEHRPDFSSAHHTGTTVAEPAAARRVAPGLELPEVGGNPGLGPARSVHGAAGETGVGPDGSVHRAAGETGVGLDGSVHRAAGEAAAGQGVEGRSLDELENEIAELGAHIDAATWLLLAVIREFDRREGWMGFASCAHWLSYRIGVDPVTAREKVRVAHALVNLPLISEAMREGRLGYSKVRALVRVATPETEEELLRLATEGTVSQVEQVVRAYRRAGREDGEQGVRRRREERYLDVYTDDEGMVVIRGRLPPDVGACLVKALEAAREILRERERGRGSGAEAEGIAGCTPESGDHGSAAVPASSPAETPQHDARASSPGLTGPAAGEDAESGREAASLVVRAATKSVTRPCPHDARASCSESSGLAAADCAHSKLAPGFEGERQETEPASRPCPHDARASSGPVGQELDRQGPEEPDWLQTQADALGLLAEAALGEGLSRLDHAEAYQVMVHVEAPVLAGASGDGFVELEGGFALSGEGGRRLTCDAPTVTVVHGADGEVLHVGRKSRRVSTPLWRALKGRDRTCRFPGCSRTGALQAHHIQHWAQGGETNPLNLLLLCRRHHWAVHEGGFRIETRQPGRPGQPGRLVFVRPDGRELPWTPRPAILPGDPVASLKSTHWNLGLRITASTPACNWDGESMDLDMAVSGLQALQAGDPAGPGTFFEV